MTATPARRRPDRTHAGPRIFLTPGEPAGIGPDLALRIALRRLPAEVVAVADPEILLERARRLRVAIDLQLFDAARAASRHRAGRLWVLPVPRSAGVRPGKPDPANAPYVLETLRRAVAACVAHPRQALVTGPVHKGVINDAGIAFTGHTEFLADLTGCREPVMMLVGGKLRVALATTHLPLSAVAAAITPARLAGVIRVLHRDLRRRFGIRRPRIVVAGLNPHAGEQGHLGNEEQKVISPVLQELRSEGLRLTGPLPADTLFTPGILERHDAVLAMYHDQGLPVLKNRSFGRAVNVTLGLPIVRTSVDHGTALELAGSGAADCGSLLAAIRLAADLCVRA